MHAINPNDHRLPAFPFLRVLHLEDYLPREKR
jgi:hypothetical protein